MAILDPSQTVYGGGNQYSAQNGFSGQFTYGQQPGGNNYPAGIQGVGTGGSGSTVGILQPQSTAAYQLNNLVDQNSPYIQQARQQAINQANTRGALNSSIAAGNAQEAAIQAALPIATNDANAYAGLQTTNLNNLNRIQTADIGAAGQLAAANASAGGMIGAAEATAAGALQRQREDLAYSGEQAGLNRAFQFGENQQQYQNQLGLQSQGYLNQYGLNQQQNMFQSGLSGQNYAQQALLSQQGYGQQSALSAQQYQQNLGLGEFNLGAGMMQNQQNFWNTLGIQGVTNPALIGDPSALGGYGQFINSQMGSAIDNIFNNVYGGQGGIGNNFSGYGYNNQYAPYGGGY